MKTLIQLLAVVLFCTAISFTAQAQVDLSVDSPILEIDFPLPGQGGIDGPAAARQPVVIDQPLILHNPKNDKCYAFRCRPAAGCEDCVLLWKDQNGDGRIQPKKELRCRCKGDAEKECQIRAREVPCKD